MTTKSPDPNEVGSIFLSDEAAEQWQSRKAQRGKVSAAADEMMLDAANLRPRKQSPRRCRWHRGPNAFGGSARWTDGLRIGHGHFRQHAQARVRCGAGSGSHERRDPRY